MVSDLTEQYDKEFDKSQLQEYGRFSVFTECIAGSKSIFSVCHNKIDVESIYDNTQQKNLTRFSKLPTKLEKNNRPVTFNKQIKSSGYGGAPNSIKYSTKEKQKIATKLTEPIYEVSRDFFGKALPTTIPSDVKILQET